MAGRRSGDGCGARGSARSRRGSPSPRAATLSARTHDGAHALVTAAGAWLDDLSDDALVRVRLADGTAVDGAGPPSTELPLHLACYRARPDVRAVVHLHRSTACCHRPGPRDPPHHHRPRALYLGRIAALPWLPSGSKAMAGAAAQALTENDTDVAVLGHHGCVTVGADLEQAFRLAANLEEAAQATYRALLLADETTTIHPAAGPAPRRDPPKGG